jgi:hypothetical protein
MTTFTPFVVPPNGIFQFQPVLDGLVYTLQVKWNVSGQRWYMYLATVRSVEVLNQALIASPPEADQDLLAGYFNSTMIFRGTTQTFEVSP